MSTIVILSESGEAAAALSASLPRRSGHEIITVGSGLDQPVPVTVGAIRDHDADVVVLAPGVRIAEGVGLAGAIETERPDLAIVLIADPTPHVLSQAMRVGVREVVPPLSVNTELGPATLRALEVVDRRRTAAGVPPSKASAHVIAVVSPKGGAGKTVVATNLAVGLARARPGEVVLVDADLQFGDVNTALRLQPESTLVDVVRRGVPDATALKLHLTGHPSNVMVLAAPDHPAQADEISSADLGKVIDLLAGSFDFVVLDTDGGLGERTLTVLEHATDHVFVCSTDVPSVRGLAKAIEALDVIGMTTAERHFVLNRADARVGLETDDIVRTIGRRFDVEIPSSRVVPESVNSGIPVLSLEERTPVSRSFNDLVERFIAPEDGSSSGRRGLFGRRD